MLILARYPQTDLQNVSISRRAPRGLLIGAEHSTLELREVRKRLVLSVCCAPAAMPFVPVQFMHPGEKM